MDQPAFEFFRLRLEIHRKAEHLLGSRPWFLLSCYGKLMDGPHAGSYVSALSAQEQLELLHRLVRGETVPVHLMHRHKSGHYEMSSLRWSQGELWMVFRDRKVIA
jgi:hypothetical protein